ncbi:MAG: PD-(D/E)XK nuclease family protein [Pseudomonadota bacterium]|nr:PD-(D/E)XK nuclease family protein [Pseudomonadota bacterium]
MTSSLIAAAQAFLQHESGRTPDFSACLILVPHHHAGQAFRQALLELLPGRHLLPPRLLTLPELAASVALGDGLEYSAEADSLRLAQLHDFLAGSGRLPRHVEWQAAQELLALVNELDAELAQPDAVLSDAARGENRYLALEASLADAVWRALAQSGESVQTRGRMHLHGARLAWLAERAERPLYCLGLAGLNGVERAFLQAWQLRAPVVTLPATPGNTARLALLQAVWTDAESTLSARGAAFGRAQAESPLGRDVALIAAPGLEVAALSAERTLTQWLAEGLREIALIAPDRLMARRLRALLERRGILVQDETGWAFSTAAVSHVVERWLRLVGDAFGYVDLLDLLKSPFVFADAVPQRLQAAHELDEAIRRHGAPDGLAGHIALAKREGLHDSLALLLRIERARAAWSAKRVPLAEWMRRLIESLAQIGAEAPLRADPVGAQLMTLLETLARDSAGHSARYTLADWRRWLFLHLEQATFRDATVSSPIRLTHLAAAHTRDLDAAIVLGVGAAHLPGKPAAAIFNDAVRGQLGLPGAGEKEALARDAFTDLLARTPRVALVWQSEIDGEAAPLSPWLLQLDVFHQAAWGSSVGRKSDSAFRHAYDVTPAEGAFRLFRPTIFPPTWPSADAVPTRISVSAWQSLVACPYQFFARHLLRLNERDEVPEEMDKRDYGSLVHRILARFHAAHPVLSDRPAAELSASLLQISLDGFAEAEAEAYLAGAWRQRWSQRIEAYVAWALAREVAGYRYESAETPFMREVEWGEGQRTRLEGRADRVDRHAGLHPNALALLDYKTQSRQTLNKKLDPNAEDVQLTAYAWLADASEAGFVTLDADKVENLDWKTDLPTAAAAEGERLRTVLAGLAQGQPLPAQGAPHVCAWCEMRGLCRREHLDEPHPAA